MNESTENLEEEQVINESSELTFPMEDEEINRLLDRKIQESKKKRTELDLDKRSKLNWKFFKGNQTNEKELDDWQLPFMDNVIYDDANYRIVMAASRIPDINVISPNEDTQSTDNADDIKVILNNRVKERSVKSMMKKGLLHLHTDFIGCIKVRWDKDKGDTGDYTFEIVNPKDLEIDMTATIPDDGFTSDNMEVIIEWINEPTKVVMAKFPKQKDALMQTLGITDPKLLPAKIRYAEAHFTFYTDNGERQEGVCWRYKKVILDKMLSPNYDWKGFLGASDKQATDQNGQALIHPFTKEPIFQQDTLYHNFFEQPHKPYIFFSYLNDADAPTEISTPIEQSIALQRNLNRRGRQINEISDNVIPKLAFNGRYITKEEVRNITKDPDEHIWIPNDDEANDAPIGDMVTQFSAAPPPPEMIADMDSMRIRMAQKFNTSNANQRTGAMRESGISKQITKEVDLAVSDDIIEIVVERVVFEIISWCMQMMKLNYDEEHYTRTLGRDGKATYISMHQDKVMDGIVVEVEVSATKQAERQSTAQFLATSQAIDPYSLLEDMNVPNEKVRIQRLLSFRMGQQDGYKAYLTELDIDPSTMPLPPVPPGGVNPQGQPDPGAGGQPQATPPGMPAAPGAQPVDNSPGNQMPQMSAQDAENDLKMLVHGQVPQPEGAPSPAYVQVFAQFVQSGQFEQLLPETQKAIQHYIEQIKTLHATPPAVQ